MKFFINLITDTRGLAFGGGALALEAKGGRILVGKYFRNFTLKLF